MIADGPRGSMIDAAGDGKPGGNRVRERGEDGPRQGVYARLDVEQRVRHSVRRPPAYVRWVGTALMFALFAAVVLAALVVSPW